MARGFLINGESMVSVKGNQDTSISTISQLGLADKPIQVTFDFRHRDMNVDAWGGEVPVDVQFMLAAVNVSMDLIHVDQTVLASCMKESMGGAGGVGNNLGQLARAGQTMGGGVARFASGNHYIGLNILSPINNTPYCFQFAYLTGPPVVLPLGTEKSVVRCNWRVIPFSTDPWGGGTGAAGTVLWSNTLDT